MCYLIDCDALGDIYSQKELDSCNVSVVPLLSSKQHPVKVSMMSEY